MIKSYYQTESESKFILSEDSDEIALLSNGSINILKINDDHNFYINVKKNDKVFLEIKSASELIRFFHRFLMFD